ncbi:hypothetical protein ACWD2L_00520 [Streptomyces sp. NPDC002754]
MNKSAQGREADEDVSPYMRQYVTYVPAGEQCVRCGQSIATLERVWRVSVARPSGPPAMGGYQHYNPCTRPR